MVYHGIPSSAEYSFSYGDATSVNEVFFSFYDLQNYHIGIVFQGI